MKRALHALSGLFGLAMFLLALWVLRRELEGRSFAEIITAAESIEISRIVVAFWVTIACYAMLTGYDLLAARPYWGILRKPSVILNSFICHAMSINVGFSSLTGGSLRCQYYLHKGLQPFDVAKIVAFCLMTFWLGFFALSGAILVIAPPRIPDVLSLPEIPLQPIGAFFLIAVTGYLLLGILRSEPIHLRQWVIPVIPASISAAQIIIAASEWLLGTLVLWILLPMHPEFTYFHLLGLYLLAQISGLFSQVPSGLGVFESIVLALVPSDLNPSDVVASLLLYRLIFNLLPLSAAGVALICREVKRRAM